jgi:hypothetical protein
MDMSFIVAGGALLLALLAGIPSTIVGSGQKRDATSKLTLGDRKRLLLTIYRKSR